MELFIFLCIAFPILIFILWLNVVDKESEYKPINLDGLTLEQIEDLKECMRDANRNINRIVGEE